MVLTLALTLSITEFMRECLDVQSASQVSCQWAIPMQRGQDSAAIYGEHSY